MGDYSYYTKPNYVLRSGLIPVYLRYNYSRKERILIPTGVKVAKENWNEEKRTLLKTADDYDKNNAKLERIKFKLSRILDFAFRQEIDPTIDFVKLELTKDRIIKSNRANISFFEQLDDFIEDRQTEVSKDVIKDYKSLKKHLTGFAKYANIKITFESLNYGFYTKFVNYLFYHVKQPNKTVGLKTNTVGKQIKNLKAFVNNRIRHKLIDPIDLSDFKTITEEVDKIYLSESELKKVYELDLSDNKEFEMIRDIFIVGCFTGLRYSDICRLKPDNIDLKQEFIFITQKKVHQQVIIPMIDYVPQILEKYNYNLPNIHINLFNTLIKKVIKKAGIDNPIINVEKKGNQKSEKSSKKYKLVSSHTMRRSFCTNMYLAGSPAEELMKISGHKTIKAFLTYIKVDNLQAAQRLKELRKKIV